MKFSLDQWRELLAQLETLKTYYARLTDRERYIVLASGAGGIVFLMILIYSALLAANSSMSSKIERGRQNLRQLQELRSVYIQTERQIRQMDQVIRLTDPSFQLGTRLEELARKRGVTMDSIKERAGVPNELYVEKQVAVSVKDIRLRTLIDFLFDIENSDQLLRISSLQVKPGFTDPTLLKVSFTVSTFQPVQGT